MLSSTTKAKAEEATGPMNDDLKARHEALPNTQDAIRTMIDSKTMELDGVQLANPRAMQVGRLPSFCPLRWKNSIASCTRAGSPAKQCSTAYCRSAVDHGKRSCIEVQQYINLAVLRL